MNLADQGIKECKECKGCQVEMAKVYQGQKEKQARSDFRECQVRIHISKCFNLDILHNEIISSVKCSQKTIISFIHTYRNITSII